MKSTAQTQKMAFEGKPLEMANSTARNSKLKKKKNSKKTGEKNCMTS